MENPQRAIQIEEVFDGIFAFLFPHRTIKFGQFQENQTIMETNRTLLQKNGKKRKIFAHKTAAWKKQFMGCPRTMMMMITL